MNDIRDFMGRKVPGLRDVIIRAQRAEGQLEEALAVIDAMCNAHVWMTGARDFAQGGRMRKEYGDRYELAYIQGLLFLNKNNYGSEK